MMIFRSKQGVARLLSLAALGLALTATTAVAQPHWHSKTLAQKQVSTLPAGPLFWEVENFASPAAARNAAQPTSLEVSVGGSAWLFTLAPKGTTIAGGAKFAEIGPVPVTHATTHVLRVAIAGGPHGAVMPAHKPASEAFYVLTGRLSEKTPSGISTADAGKSLVGSTPKLTVSSTGKQDLNAFVLSVGQSKRMSTANSK